MNDLLGHLSQFIKTTLELYPLPYELVTDLHTLNAYLKSYSPQEEVLLEAFVNRQVDKLRHKMRRSDEKETISTITVQLCE